MENVRVSVRGLVEFTLHGEDICLGGGTRAMQDGTLGHQARQKMLGEEWLTEVPLEMEIPQEDLDVCLRVAGRMDALRDGDVPLIEEIKLWQGKQKPEQANPAHWAQAVCYGYMLCRERSIGQVQVRVSYVSRQGGLRGQFEEIMTEAACKALFDELLTHYLARLRLVRAHMRERDATLRGLRFPFETYRAGQREMAVQVYTAIRLGKRLFASMPTGTGKSCAVLFPALKAMGEGWTGRVYYLTARTTQRQGPTEALARMRTQPLRLWTLTLDAKDKQCPSRTLCHPDFCPRAKGHFLRDEAAINEMLREDDWSPERIREVADAHCLCPFEFSLSLCELADLTICDYNYALDPAVHIQRIFDRTSDVTLLIDEAHNLLPRVREMLSGAVDGGRIRRLRTVVGKAAGRKHDLYQAMTKVLRAIDDLPREEDAREGQLSGIPQSLENACQELTDAFLDAQGEHFPWEEAGERMMDTLSELMGFVRVMRRERSAYAFLWQGGRDCRVTALALDVGTYFASATARMRGVVCFSATMHPLEDMKRLLGGEEEDACFAMPSPFPRENLLVLRQAVNTRYANRKASCECIAQAIAQVVRARAGRYIAFFPSFAYMEQVSAQLDMPHQTQRPGMSDEERRTFLSPYEAGGEPVLSLCVLGGIFAEGIDLPGSALDGVIVVGVGLPTVNLFQETLRAWYEQEMGAGFLYAYQLPGMQKVGQAVGRVIRTETDVGVAVLLDDRYRQGSYLRLCPEHWQIRDGPLEARLNDFWQAHSADAAE